MKRITLITMAVIIAMLSSCDPIANTPEDPPTETNDGQPPVIESGIQSRVQFAVYDGQDVRFWDGTQLHDGHTGNVRPAAPRALAIENVLYQFDEQANTLSSQWLPVVPDEVLITVGIGSRGTVVYDGPVYTLETIPPDEAYALGALPRTYTRIMVDGEEVGNWYMNEWETGEVLQTASGHVLVRTVNGAWKNLTDDKVIETAYQGGIMTYDMGTEHGYIADGSGEYEITWDMNFFDHSRFQLADGVWYTENGYTWTAATGVISDANSMYGWNNHDTYPASYDAPYPNRPYFLPAGVRAENGEEVTYWIETVTGVLYRHIPSIDDLSAIVELYEGPDDRQAAAAYFNTLDPEIIEGFLYFHVNGAIKRLDFSSGIVSLFSTDQEVMAW